MFNLLVAMSLILLAGVDPANAVPSLKQVAPGVVIDVHCKQTSYPHFWQALERLQVKQGRVAINATLALSDVEPEVQSLTNFRDECLIALMHEHVRPTLDEALHILIKLSDERIHEQTSIDKHTQPSVENAANH